MGHEVIRKRDFDSEICHFDSKIKKIQNIVV
jgi:hypothetical protein